MTDHGNVENTRELRKRIQAARAYAGGMSLDEFAKRVGIGRQTLVRIENGERPAIKRMELREMADTAGLPYEFFTIDFARLKAVQEESIAERLELVEAEIRRLVTAQGAPAPPGELGRRAEGSQPSDEHQRPDVNQPEAGHRRGGEG